MDDQFNIKRRIEFLRRYCLVHRYLYYFQCKPVVSDVDYDLHEKELLRLVEQNEHLASIARYADECPTKNVGSSLLENYPKEIQILAESLASFDNAEYTNRMAEQAAFGEPEEETPSMDGRLF